MTIGQWSELLFIGSLPFLLGKVAVRWLMLIGLGCSAVRCLSFAAFALAGELPLAVFALAMHGPVRAFTFVCMQLFMEKNLPLETRNRSQALVSMFGSGLGPLTGLSIVALLASRTILPDDGGGNGWIVFWAVLSLLQFGAAGAFLLKLRHPSGAGSPAAQTPPARGS